MKQQRLHTSFFELSTKTLAQRVALIEGYYKQILEKPFDFSKDEYIEVDYEKNGLC